MCSTLRTIHSMYRRFCQDQNEIHAIGNKRRHCDLDMPSSGCTRFKNEHTTARASRIVFFVDNDENLHETTQNLSTRDSQRCETSA